jgi:hypothetical protein
MFSGKWIDVEIMMLSNISQIQKDNIACFLSYVKYRPMNIYHLHKHMYIYVKGRLFLRGGKEKVMECV